MESYSVTIILSVEWKELAPSAYYERGLRKLQSGWVVNEASPIKARLPVGKQLPP
ncbi:hypothetical protein [Dyadobacter sp. 676]|uniref:Uncharacterized protein n=1 Tax=Dyadobacter sp. 676 TaxID=3088362 RepID=A0AAU8FCP1_9BACT